jgi:oxygen-dependent protoporphyrinogen oxidase
VDNETLAAAVRRRFNEDILQTLVNPIISGIYAGNSEKLEYKSSMKKLYQFEQEFGSFTKGFLSSKKKGETRKVVTFKYGLQHLISVLTENLIDNIVNAEVKKIETSSSQISITTKCEKYCCSKVVISTPAYVTSMLIHPLNKSLSARIARIKYPSLLSVQLAFDKKFVKSHLDAFGLLIPKQAGKVTLGIINYSSVFENNSTLHKYNLFVGVNEPVTETYVSYLIEKAIQELKEIYDIEGTPLFLNHKLWDKAIPQFNVGHYDLMERVDQFENENPNISIIGNWRTGVAIGDCIHY